MVFKWHLQLAKELSALKAIWYKELLDLSVNSPILSRKKKRAVSFIESYQCFKKVDDKVEMANNSSKTMLDKFLIKQTNKQKGEVLSWILYGPVLYLVLFTAYINNLNGETILTFLDKKSKSLESRNKMYDFVR